MTTPSRHPETGRFVPAPMLPDGSSVDSDTGTVTLPGGASHVDHRLRRDYVGPGPNQPCCVSPVVATGLPAGGVDPDSWVAPS